MNINAVAEKYGGAMSIETQENVFVLHVLLIIPQQPAGKTQGGCKGIKRKGENGAGKRHSKTQGRT